MAPPSCKVGDVEIEPFAFIGFYECRERNLQRLSEWLVIPLAVDIAANKTDDTFTAERENLTASAAAMSQLRAQLAEEIAFGNDYPIANIARELHRTSVICHRPE